MCSPAGCGAAFTGVTSGRIVSPGYPGRNYPDGITCDYVINWNQQQSVALLFDDPFAIEGVWLEGQVDNQP